MKKCILSTVIVIFLFAFKSDITKDQNKQLFKAYSEKNYFILDKLMSGINFNSNNPDLLLYKATLDNVFNKPLESNKLINIILDKYIKHFNDSIIANLFSMKSINSAKLEDYKEAYKNNQIIFTKYSGVYDSIELHSRRMDNDMYQNIFDIPKMKLEKIATTFPLKRDIAGLYNIPVIIKNDTVDFVFDTGANFSVITESLAKKYGVKPIGNTFKVGTSTSIEIDAQAGICDMTFGKLKIKNVLVTIFPDSTLSFANGMYVIKGVVGLPVMLEFQQFTIKDDKSMIIPKDPEVTSERNFAVDGFMGVILVKYNNDTLPFHFDTGATATFGYSRFFKKYNSEIIYKSKKGKNMIGGAGGSEESITYKIDSVILSAGNSQCKLDSLTIFDKDISGVDVKYVYGNFGQDYIKQFSEMTINLSSMNISFSNKK